MFGLNTGIEQMIIERFKGEIEDMLNLIMYYEREEFLQEYKTYAAGFHTRKLQTTLQFNLELKVPKVRKHARELSYSIFKKYQRNTQEFENLVEKMYTSRLYESDVADLLAISSISDARKKRIISEFYDKYLDFIEEKKKASEVIKLDCTYFQSKKAKTKYSVYTVFNCLPSGLEMIYFDIQIGNENKAGWEKTIDYLAQNVDLSDCKLVVTDMFRNLKEFLHEKEEFKHIKKQNCIWHRIQSLCDCVKVNKAQRNQLVSDIYVEFIKMKQVNDTVFDVFKQFESRVKKIEGYTAIRNVEKAIKVNYNDNFSFLDVRKDLKHYKKRHLLVTSDVEGYFSKLKFYLKKNRNYTSTKVLASKIMMFLEHEKRNKLNKNSNKI